MTEREVRRSGVPGPPEDGAEDALPVQGPTAGDAPRVEGPTTGDAPRVAGPTAEDAVRVEGLTFGYPRRPVLSGVDLRVGRGELVALTGLNGCGKSTLLRLAAGLLRPAAGRVLVGGTDLARLSRRATARRVALLHQSAPPVPGMTVRQLVRQGRYAARGPLGMLREGDDEATVRALADAGVADWAARAVDTLSGGERQRVRLAVALAQDTPVLLLDEPTTYLDLRHQLEVLQTVVRLRAQRSLTVVMVLHDLNHAARFAERIVALREGRIAADGTPDEVVTPRLLAEVLGVAGRVGRDPVGGWPVCYPDRPLPLDGEPEGLPPVGGELERPRPVVGESARLLLDKHPARPLSVDQDPGRPRPPAEADPAGSAPSARHDGDAADGEVTRAGGEVPRGSAEVLRASAEVPRAGGEGGRLP